MTTEQIFGSDEYAEGFDWARPFQVIRDEDGYSVHLPHQCESWGITERYESVTKEQAIAALEVFLENGQAALAALRAHDGGESA